MPKTKLGKISAWFILAFIVLYFAVPLLTNLLYRDVPAGDSILADVSGRPVLAISMLLVFASAITAIITGFVSVIKQKERSPLVYVAILIGLLVSVFLIVEIIAPH